MAEIRLFQPIGVPKELLWRYISTASGLSCWQADEVRGDLEAGEFSLRWPSLGARMDLSVKSAHRHRSVTLGAGQNVLSLELGNGGLLLTHLGLEETDDLEGLRCSWRLALALLKQAVEVHPQKPRRVHWQFCPIEMDRELLYYYFSDPRGLSQWLGSTASELIEGQGYEISLDGQDLGGRVLISERGRDLALSVSPLGDAVLVLRTLPAREDSRVVAAGVSVWNDVDTTRLDQDLELGLRRLAALCGEATPS